MGGNVHVPDTSGFAHQQCKAQSKSMGRQCGNPAIPGSTVCRVHGGSAPQVRRKAAMRLLELVDPAVATLAKTMVDKDAPHAARIRAAENVLDRAGLPRRVDVTDTEAARDLLVERLLTLRQNGGRAAPPPAPGPEIVAGTVESPSIDPPTS